MQTLECLLRSSRGGMEFCRSLMGFLVGCLTLFRVVGLGVLGSGLR